MIRKSLATLILCAGIAACAPPAETAAEARNASGGTKVTTLADKESLCIPASKMGLSAPSKELVGEIRTRFLTPEASLARVRVFVSGTEITSYGSTTVYYTNETSDCILWAESLTIQELVQRAGLNPLGISPFYLPDTTKVSEAPVAK
jgi:hypothetical protein